MIVVGDDAYAIFATAGAARAFRIGAEPGRARARGRRAARDHLGGRGRPAAHLSVRPRARLSRSTSSCSRRSPARWRAVTPPDLRARRGDAAAAAQPAGHGPRRDRRLSRPRAPPTGDDGFDFRGVEWLGRDRDIRTAVSARAFRDVRQAPPSRARAEYLGFGENEPARGFYLPAARRHARRGRDAARLRLVARRLEPADLGRGAGHRRQRARRRPRRRGGDRHRRRLHRHRDQGPRRPRRLSHPPFRHPRPGDAAAARMPGAAGAADQLRRRRVRTAC